MKKALKAIVPRHRKHLITDEFCETVENMSDPEFREAYKENLFRFADIWDKYSGIGLRRFAEAALFVTHRLMGHSQLQAYIRTFPDRYERLCKEGKERHAAQYATAFSKKEIVAGFMERSLVPVYLMNADLHQEAINVQADLMRSAKSENVRMKAAECLIIALKPPEDIQVNVSVDHRSSQLDELREVTRKLAVQQKKAIQDGIVAVEDIAESEIIEAKFLVHEEDRGDSQRSDEVN